MKQNKQTKKHKKREVIRFKIAQVKSNTKVEENIDKTNISEVCLAFQNE